MEKVKQHVSHSSLLTRYIDFVFVIYEMSHARQKSDEEDAELLPFAGLSWIFRMSFWPKCVTIVCPRFSSSILMVTVGTCEDVLTIVDEIGGTPALNNTGNRRWRIVNFARSANVDEEETTNGSLTLDRGNWSWNGRWCFPVAEVSRCSTSIRPWLTGRQVFEQSDWIVWRSLPKPVAVIYDIIMSFFSFSLYGKWQR